MANNKNGKDDHGHTKYQPLYKSCNVNRIPPHLLLSYRNISVVCTGLNNYFIIILFLLLSRYTFGWMDMKYSAIIRHQLWVINTEEWKNRRRKCDEKRNIKYSKTTQRDYVPRIMFSFYWVMCVFVCIFPLWTNVHVNWCFYNGYMDGWIHTTRFLHLMRAKREPMF